MRAAAYARYSTDKQTDNSIAYQISAIQKYCSNNNITLCAFFTDEAETGTNTNRQGFIDMVAAANRHEFDAVVIYDISRGSRDVADWFNFRKAMQILRVKVISVEDNLGNIDNPNDFLVELINVGLGQHMVLQTRQKSMAGVATKAKEGAFLGGTPPLGYDIFGGKYVINEFESAAIKLIFNLYASGNGYGYIVDRLKELGTRSKRGEIIGNNAIYAILRNERYIGKYTWNKRITKYMGKWAGGADNPQCITVENAIPPIIDTDTWERVKVRLKSNTNAKNKAKREYMLSGLLRCAECGGSMVGITRTSQKGYETRYYTCANKHRLHNCKSKNVNADELEVLVVTFLRSQLKDDLLEETVDAILAQKAPDETESIKKAISSCDRKIQNIVNAVAEGFKSQNMKETLEAEENKKAALTEKLKSVRAASIERDEVISLLEKLKEGDTKELVKKVVHKIEISSEGIHINPPEDINKTGCGGRI